VAKAASNPARAAAKAVKVAVDAKRRHLAVSLSAKQLHLEVRRKAELHVVNGKRTKVHPLMEQPLLYGRRKSNIVSHCMKCV
jgi:hypothetical protein